MIVNPYAKQSAVDRDLADKVDGAAENNHALWALLAGNLAFIALALGAIYGGAWLVHRLWLVYEVLRAKVGAM
jgi:hypothetical protein